MKAAAGGLRDCRDLVDQPKQGVENRQRMRRAAGDVEVNGQDAFDRIADRRARTERAGADAHRTPVPTTGTSCESRSPVWDSWLQLLGAAGKWYPLFIVKLLLYKMTPVPFSPPPFLPLFSPGEEGGSGFGFRGGWGKR